MEVEHNMSYPAAIRSMTSMNLYDIYELERLTQFITHVCTGISMLGVGCVISVKDFQRKETRLAKSLCMGLFLHTMIQPLTGYIIAILLDMEVYEALAMIVIASGPSATYASVLSYWGDGNVALSVCIACLSTALAIGMMPMWFYFYSSTWSQGYFVVAYPLDIAHYLLLVIGPVAFGMSIRWCLPKAARQLAKICSPAFLLGIFACSVLFFIFHRQNFQVSWHLYLASFMLPFFGFFFGFLIALIFRMPYDVCIAISLAVGSINGPLAVTVSLNAFEEATEEFVLDVLSLPLIYAIFAPIEGICWSMMYKTVDEMFTKGHPALCGPDEEA